MASPSELAKAAYAQRQVTDPVVPEGLQKWGFDGKTTGTAMWIGGKLYFMFRVQDDPRIPSWSSDVRVSDALCWPAAMRDSAVAWMDRVRAWADHDPETEPKNDLEVLGAADLARD